jgi:hypothetical protein
VDLNTDVIGYIGTSNSPKHMESKKKKDITVERSPSKKARAAGLSGRQ